MFDITSSKLLILGMIALIVVGPKDLPMLLRTIGKYVAMIRRQANEFKAQFDDAMRESELDKLKKEVEQVGQAAENSISETERSINTEISKANAAIDTNLNQPLTDKELDRALDAVPSPPAFTPSDTTSVPPLSAEHGGADTAQPAPVSAAPVATPASQNAKVGA